MVLKIIFNRFIKKFHCNSAPYDYDPQNFIYQKLDQKNENKISNKVIKDSYNKHNNFQSFFIEKIGIISNSKEIKILKLEFL